MEPHIECQLRKIIEKEKLYHVLNYIIENHSIDDFIRAFDHAASIKYPNHYIMEYTGDSTLSTGDDTLVIGDLAANN